MEPWQSWAAAVCIGGAAFWYYAKDSKYFMKPREGRSGSISEQTGTQTPRRRNDKQTPRRKENNAKANNTPATYADIAATPAASITANASKKRKAGRATAPPNGQPVNPPEVTKVEKDAEDLDMATEDKEWARQLDASHKGVSFGASTAANQQKVKSQHQSKAKSLQPTSNGVISTPQLGGDVSDMLEPTPAAPSVVRVTGTQEQKKKQAPKPEVPQETKKQRQNRRKAEEKKMQREEDERQRQALLETQRRSAREARGEPAKNGLSTASPPTKTVWTASVQTGGQPNGSAPATAPVMNANETSLLDTFEPDGVSTASSNEVNTNATTPATAASTADQDLPSEEAQLEMLNKLSENNGWNEVPSKGKKGKKKQSSTTTGSATPLSPTSSNGKDNNNPFAAISSNDTADTPEQAPPVLAPQTNNSTNGISAFEKATMNAPKVKGHPEDSDWAVF